jgi:hypothetical protein
LPALISLGNTLLKGVLGKGGDDDEDAPFATIADKSLSKLKKETDRLEDELKEAKRIAAEREAKTEAEPLKPETVAERAKRTVDLALGRTTGDIPAAPRKPSRKKRRKNSQGAKGALTSGKDKVK